MGSRKPVHHSKRYRVFQRNLNPAGRLGCIVFGLAQLIDGAVRVVSGGFFHTTVPLTVSREQARRHIQNLKRARQQQESEQ